MISFKIRFFIARIKYFFQESLPWYIAYLIPRKIALFCFVRVYSVLGSFSDDYSNAYNIWESGKGK